MDENRSNKETNDDLMDELKDSAEELLQEVESRFQRRADEVAKEIKGVVKDASREIRDLAKIYHAGVDDSDVELTQESVRDNLQQAANHMRRKSDSLNTGV